MSKRQPKPKLKPKPELLSVIPEAWWPTLLERDPALERSVTNEQMMSGIMTMHKLIVARDPSKHDVLLKGIEEIVKVAALEEHAKPSTPSTAAAAMNEHAKPGFRKKRVGKH